MRKLLTKFISILLTLNLLLQPLAPTLIYAAQSTGDSLGPASAEPPPSEPEPTCTTSTFVGECGFSRDNWCRIGQSCTATSPSISVSCPSTEKIRNIGTYCTYPDGRKSFSGYSDCVPDSSCWQSTPEPIQEATDCTAGIRNQYLRKECDPAIGKMVWIEQWLQPNCDVTEKPGSVTDEFCPYTQPATPQDIVDDYTAAWSNYTTNIPTGTTQRPDTPPEPPPGEPICSLSAIPQPSSEGKQEVTWTIYADPIGQKASWKEPELGNKLVDVEGYPSGSPYWSKTYTYTQPATYTREAVINYSSAQICTTNPITITINPSSVGTAPVEPDINIVTNESRQLAAINQDVAVTTDQPPPDLPPLPAPREDELMLEQPAPPEPRGEVIIGAGSQDRALQEQEGLSVQYSKRLARIQTEARESNEGSQGNLTETIGSTASNVGNVGVGAAQAIGGAAGNLFTGIGQIFQSQDQRQAEEALRKAEGTIPKPIAQPIGVPDYCSAGDFNGTPETNPECYPQQRFEKAKEIGERAGFKVEGDPTNFGISLTEAPDLRAYTVLNEAPLTEEENEAARKSAEALAKFAISLLPGGAFPELVEKSNQLAAETFVVEAVCKQAGFVDSSYVRKLLAQTPKSGQKQRQEVLELGQWVNPQFRQQTEETRALTYETLLARAKAQDPSLEGRLAEVSSLSQEEAKAKCGQETAALETKIKDLNTETAVMTSLEVVGALPVAEVGVVAVKKGAQVAKPVLRKITDPIGNVAKGAWDATLGRIFGGAGKEVAQEAARLNQIRVNVERQLVEGLAKNPNAYPDEFIRNTLITEGKYTDEEAEAALERIKRKAEEIRSPQTPVEEAVPEAAPVQVFPEFTRAQSLDELFQILREAKEIRVGDKIYTADQLELIIIRLQNAKDIQQINALLKQLPNMGELRTTARRLLIKEAGRQPAQAAQVTAEQIVEQAAPPGGKALAKIQNAVRGGWDATLGRIFGGAGKVGHVIDEQLARQVNSNVHSYFLDNLKRSGFKLGDDLEVTSVDGYLMVSHTNGANFAASAIDPFGVSVPQILEYDFKNLNLTAIRSLVKAWEQTMAEGSVTKIGIRVRRGDDALWKSLGYSPEKDGTSLFTKEIKPVSNTARPPTPVRTVEQALEQPAQPVYVGSVQLTQGTIDDTVRLLAESFRNTPGASKESLMRWVATYYDEALSPEQLDEIATRALRMLAEQTAHVPGIIANAYHGMVDDVGRAGQDVVSVVPNFGGRRDAILAGVYDGHGNGGKQAANIASRITREDLLLLLGSGWDEPQAITGAFSLAHQEIIDAGVKDGGASTVTVLIKGNELYVANAGDARAVLGSRDQARRLSVDHNTRNPMELQRVTASGGKVDGPYFVRRDGSGGLQVSRSLGDSNYSQFSIPNPTVGFWRLSEEDEFVIVASDGLWGKMSDQEAVETVRAWLAQGYDLDRISQGLADIVRQRGEDDDITVAVVLLKQVTGIPIGYSVRQSIATDIINYAKPGRLNMLPHTSAFLDSNVDFWQWLLGDLVKPAFALEEKASTVADSRSFEFAVKGELLKRRLIETKSLDSKYVSAIAEENLLLPLTVTTADGYLFVTGKNGSSEWAAEPGKYRIEIASIPGVDIKIPGVVDVKEGQKTVIPVAIKKGTGKVEKTATPTGWRWLLNKLFGTVFAQEKKESQVQLVVFSDTNNNGKIDKDEQVLPWAGLKVELKKVNQDRILSLIPGWNLVALEVLPQKPINASTLLQEIAKQGGYTTTVSVLENGAWKSFVVRGDKTYSGDDFPISPGKAYFVKALKPSMLVYQGQELVAPIKLKLTSGWNGVGVPYSEKPYQAADFIDTLNTKEAGSDTASRWESGLWDTFVKLQDQRYGENFMIEQGRGYLLKVAKGLEFSP